MTSYTIFGVQLRTNYLFSAVEQGGNKGRGHQALQKDPTVVREVSAWPHEKEKAIQTRDMQLVQIIMVIDNPCHRMVRFDEGQTLKSLSIQNTLQ